MFGSQITHSVVAFLDYDPAADDQIPLWRAPAACEVVGIYATPVNAIAGSGTNYIDIGFKNGGSAGTATTALGGTVGGTAAWAASTPVSSTISEGTLAAGDVVVANYDEFGTGTFTAMAIQIDYRLGVAAN